MIPSLKDILAGYRDGSYSEEQCLAWLERHLHLSHEEGYNLRADMEGPE